MATPESGSVVNEFATKNLGLAAALVTSGIRLKEMRNAQRHGGTGGHMKAFVFEVIDDAQIERIKIAWAGKQLEGNLVEFFETSGRLRKMLHQSD